MPIHYICLSDLHLGAETSLLTELDAAGAPRYGETSPALRALAEALRAIPSGEERPVLVLAGDVLELALADTDQAATCFERLLDAFFPGGTPDVFAPRILYVPGNHDHHLWETAREEHYADYLLSDPGRAIGPPWHVTRMFERDDARVGWPRSRLLDALAARHRHRSGRSEPLDIRVVYPNFGLANASRSLVISHGHYIEAIYQLMSTLRQVVFPGAPAATTVEAIEAENFAWVDFFWSTMGRSGQVGEDVQKIYELAGSKEGMNDLADRLAKGVVTRWLDDDGVPDGLETSVLRKLLLAFAKRAAARERAEGREALGAGARKGLGAFVDGPLFRQIEHERRSVGGAPPELTFVFGHTHKPFESLEASRSFAKPVTYVNTGGWVVDSVEARPLSGASVVLVDDGLECAALRVFDEPARGARPAPVRVAVDPRSPATPGPLHLRLRAHLSERADLWTRLTDAVGVAIDLRAKALAERTRAR